MSISVCLRTMWELSEIHIYELEHVFDKFLKYHIKILLDFSAKVGREDISKSTIGNESLHEINNDNGV
jgi:hypothetical protein